VNFLEEFLVPLLLCTFRIIPFTPIDFYSNYIKKKIDYNLISLNNDVNVPTVSKKQKITKIGIFRLKRVIEKKGDIDP
jgi:hypothetical protein